MPPVTAPCRSLSVEAITRLDECGGILVQTQPDGERVVGERREQSAEPVALPEVLVDDELVGQAEARCHRDHVGARGAALDAACNHVLGHECRACRRTGNVHAFDIAAPDSLRDFRTADGRRQPQLVATGHEHAVGILQRGEEVRILAVHALDEGQHVGVRHADLHEQAAVAVAGVVQLGGGRDDRDARVLAAADLDESIQHLTVAQLLLGATDGDDVAALSAGWEG